jgi:16S rRNA (uracil1498-N3)-methyltransferase
MAEVCERLTELGASSIWPVITDRTVPRLDSNKTAGRQARWQKIAREAAQLANRHAIPRVEPPLPLLSAISRLDDLIPTAQRLACDARNARLSLNSTPWDPTTPTVLLIGPEGGLSPAELERLAPLGFLTVSLGPRNLRTLLAGAVALTILLQRAGDLELQRA